MMEPLGQRLDMVNVESVTKWNMTQLPEFRDSLGTRSNSISIPFVWRNDINAKVSIWDGDQLTLDVDAIVNPTNEAMNDQTGESGDILRKAGPQLEHDIHVNIRGCKTGDARLTEGHGLLSRYIVHTVGPRYNVRYSTAAESALYSCYRSVLHICREASIETVALPCIHSLGRGYPPEDGAHIALRTVRRFLEKHGDQFERIIFVVTEPNAKGIYQELFPLYFPRSQDEAERAWQHLPLDIGNEEGEPIIPERQIRILDNPTALDDTSNDLDNDLDDSISNDLGQRSFAQMKDDVDKSKRVNAVSKTEFEQVEIIRQKRYECLLQKSRTTDLSSIAALHCLYQSGVDRMGRPIIIFIGRNLPSTDMHLEQMLLYFIQVMDPVVVKEYVIVYFHTLTRPSNRPGIRFMRTVYEIVDERYKRNMKSFYVIHATLWSRVATWLFTTFRTQGIKKKVQNLAGIEHLFSRMNPDELDIPDFILDYDLKINGQRYYVPSDRDVREVTEGL